MIKPMLTALLGSFEELSIGLEEDMARNVSPFAVHLCSE
jgi:hypothetical protein